MKNGWHRICGYDVWVENGCVIRGTIWEGYGMRTAFPYRAAHDGGWDLDSGITVDAFRSAVKRGTVEMR